MYRIFISLLNWLDAFFAQPPAPDVLDRLTPVELADLPATHPVCDPEPC